MGLAGVVSVVSAFLMAAISSYILPVLNPTVYRSVDGGFELLVDPSEPDGSGPAHYRLTQDGTVVWEREHSFTFFNAAVREDGTVAGAAYSRGLAGGGYGEDDGDLRLVVFAPNGTIRFEQVLPRRFSSISYGQPVPQSKGVLLDVMNGRALFRLIPDSSGKEYRYDLSGLQ